MNQSSLFSLDGSTIWDPKIKLRLLIPEDQLNILNTMQGWNKAQDNNTIRIEKDSLIENSLPQNSISVSQNNEKIRRKQNIELFDKQQQHRRSILKACKIYNTKFTKSLSLLDISEAESNSKTYLKRTSSLSSVYHLLNFSHVKYTAEPSGEKCSPEKLSLLPNTKKLSNFPALYCKNKIVSFALQSKDSFCNKDITSEAMEVVLPQLPVSISANIGKVVDNDTAFKTLEEKLPQPCNNQSVSSPGKLVKHDTSSLSEVKISSNSCENNNLDSSKLKETVLVSIDENTESNQLYQDKRKCEDNKAVEVLGKTDFTNTDAICSNENICVDLNSQKSDESFVSTSQKADHLRTAEEKMPIDANSVSVKKVDVSSGIQKLNETLKECVKPIQVIIKEQSCKESLHSNGKNAHENCNKLNDEKMDVSENALKALNIAGNSGKLVTGKRKSDSKTHKSKKLKSEGKQERAKVKSIKKVGEISYCAEDVKDMLNIINFFL